MSNLEIIQYGYSEKNPNTFDLGTKSPGVAKVKLSGTMSQHVHIYIIDFLRRGDPLPELNTVTNKIISFMKIWHTTIEEQNELSLLNRKRTI